MKTIPLFTILLAASPVLCSYTSAARPWEVILEREPSGTCRFITQRQTQIFRKLPRDGSHVSKQKAVNGNEKINIIAHSKRIGWSKAYSLCPSLEEDTHLGLSTQSVMDLSGSSMPVQSESLSIPLKIEPLIQSGSSSNRVDLVFFSDGCTYTGNFTHPVLTERLLIQ